MPNKGEPKMAKSKMMTAEEFDSYEDIIPVANNVLVEIVDKAPTRILDSGLHVQEAAVTNAKPYFVVTKVSEVVKRTDLDIDVGDIVETGGGHVNFFYGKEAKRYALLNVGTISGVYKKRKE